MSAPSFRYFSFIAATYCSWAIFDGSSHRAFSFEISLCPIFETNTQFVIR